MLKDLFDFEKQVFSNINNYLNFLSGDILGKGDNFYKNISISKNENHIEKNEKDFAFFDNPKLFSEYIINNLSEKNRQFSTYDENFKNSKSFFEYIHIQDIFGKRSDIEKNNFYKDRDIANYKTDKSNMSYLDFFKYNNILKSVNASKNDIKHFFYNTEENESYRSYYNFKKENVTNFLEYFVTYKKADSHVKDKNINQNEKNFSAIINEPNYNSFFYEDKNIYSEKDYFSKTETSFNNEEGLNLYSKNFHHILSQEKSLEKKLYYREDIDYGGVTKAISNNITNNIVNENKNIKSGHKEAFAYRDSNINKNEIIHIVTDEILKAIGISTM